MLAKFTGLKSPTFDDYIEDLAVMFDMYQTKDDQQLHELRKDWHAALNGYKRIKPIKRTRKRQIERAKFMDHTGYEWSQWWHKTARKPKRWKQ